MRRPLTLILCLAIAASVVGSLLPNLAKLPLLIAVTAGTLALLISRRGQLSSGFSRTTLISFCGIGAIIMLVPVCAANARLEFYRELADSKLTDSDITVSEFTDAEPPLPEHTITAAVVAVEYEASYTATYAVRLESLDGEPKSSRGLLFCDNFTGLEVGDYIECIVNFEPLDEVYSFYDIGEDELAADGYDFACRLVGEVTLLGQDDVVSQGIARLNTKIEISLNQLRSYLSSKLWVYLDRDTSRLVSALLFGIRDEPELLSRNFRIIGASHLLALSGLHIAIVCGIFSFFFRKLCIPTRPRALLTILVVVFYLSLTGFPYSAIRAALMVIFVQIAKLFRHDSDRINSLLFAAALILLFNPHAIFDMGFTLSFSATLGLIVLSEARPNMALRKLFRKLLGKKLSRRVSSLISAVTMTLGAVTFLVPLQWLYFGEMSMLSPVSSLILTPICELMLWLLIPCLVCSLLGLSLLADRFGLLVELLYDALDAISSNLAQSTKLVSLKYPFVPILIVLCTALLIVLIVRTKKRLLLLIPLGAFVLALYSGIGIYERLRADEAALVCFSHKSNEAFMLTVGNQGCIIDIGDGTKTALESAVSELSEQCITEVDTLILTHIHRRHISAIRSVCENRMVRRILIPEPTDESENAIATDLVEVAEHFSVEVGFLPRPEETAIFFGDVSLTLAEKRYIDRSVHPLIGLEFGLPDGYVLYLGSSTWEDIGVVGFGDDADVVIYGSHGPVIKSAPGLLFASQGDLTSGDVTRDEPRIYSTNELVARSIGADLVVGRLSVTLGGELDHDE